MSLEQRSPDAWVLADQNREALDSLRWILANADQGFYIFTADTVQLQCAVADFLKASGNSAVFDYAAMNYRSYSYGVLEQWAEQNEAQSVYFVINLQVVLSKDTDFINLNLSRDMLARQNKIWIFGVTRETDNRLAVKSADFYSFVRIRVSFLGGDTDSQTPLISIEHSGAFASVKEARDFLNAYSSMEQEYLNLPESADANKLLSAASTLINIADAYHFVGDDLSAAKCSRKSFTIQKALRGEAHPSTLRALSKLSISLGETGQRQEALAATQEAVKYYRELTERNRDAFLPGLAMSINNLANRLSGVGRREDALAAAQEAVEYYQELTERNRSAFLPGLAGSINNLAISLSAIGHREDALAAAQEAVKYRRELTERNRDAFLPDFAMSINNLAAFLSEVGRREEALAATQEAVKYRRELTERNRDAFLPGLAGSIHNLAADLSDVGHREEALAAAQEAVKYYKELAERYRDAFLPDLAMSLNNLAVYLRNVNRDEEAAQVEQEAQMLRKELDAKRQ